MLGAIIIQSAGLWVFDSCSETDVLDGVPRGDEGDDMVGDNIEPMMVTGK